MDQGESEYLDELMEALYNEESSKTWEKGLSSGVNVNDVAKKNCKTVRLNEFRAYFAIFKSSLLKKSGRDKQR